VEVGEFGALNFDECYVQKIIDENERIFALSSQAFGSSLKAASNIQAFGMRMMALIALIVLYKKKHWPLDEVAKSQISSAFTRPSFDIYSRGLWRADPSRTTALPQTFRA